MTPSYGLDPLPDIPADFGPDIPDGGIEGVLRSADPEDACSPFNFTDFQTPWIALIARQQQLHANNCTFDVKVLNAQMAGAIAAIVYDDMYESLIIMSKPKGHPDPDIPSVFVSQKAGIIMRKLMTLDTIRVRITPLSSVAWLSMLMSAFLGLLALGVVLATFYVMRSWSLWITGMAHRGHGGPGGAGAGAAGAPGGPGTHRHPAGEPGLPAEALRLLPVIVFEPQATKSSATRVPSGALGSGGPSAAASLSASASVGGSMPPNAWVAGRGGGGGNAAESGAEEGAECGCRVPLLGADEEEGGGGGEFLDAGERVSRSSSDSGGLPVPSESLRVGSARALAARAARPPGAHAGETKRVCAICLESYEEGEKIRILPCAHRFHMDCVDQWLGGRRFCPVCKHDASQPLPPPAVPAARGGAGGQQRRGGAGARHVVNGWTLLMQGFADLLRQPSAADFFAARAAGPRGADGQRDAARSARNARSGRRGGQQPPQQRQAQQRPGGQAPELQEPLLPRDPQTRAQRLAAAGAVAAPDVEAAAPAGLSRPAASAASAAGGAGTSRATQTHAIVIPSAAAAEASGQAQQPPAAAGAGGAQGAAEATRGVRGLFAGWLRGAAGRLATAAPPAAADFPSTL